MFGCQSFLWYVPVLQVEDLLSFGLFLWMAALGPHRHPIAVSQSHHWHYHHMDLKGTSANISKSEISVISVTLCKSISPASSYQRSKIYRTVRAEMGLSVDHFCAPMNSQAVCSLGRWDGIRNEQAQWSGVICAVDRAVLLEVDYNKASSSFLHLPYIVQCSFPFISERLFS